MEPADIELLVTLMQLLKGKVKISSGMKQQSDFLGF